MERKKSLYQYFIIFVLMLAILYSTNVKASDNDITGTMRGTYNNVNYSVSSNGFIVNK